MTSRIASGEYLFCVGFYHRDGNYFPDAGFIALPLYTETSIISTFQGGNKWGCLPNKTCYGVWSLMMTRALCINATKLSTALNVMQNDSLMNCDAAPRNAPQINALCLSTNQTV